MSIDDSKCEICGDELAMDNYYYIYAGRLQQGPQSDKKSMLEYTLCTNCYAQIKAELMVSVQRKKMQSEKKEGV
jgi:hypothetical protein